MHIRQRVRFAVPGPENGGAADQSDGVCGYVHYLFISNSFAWSFADALKCV